MRNMQQTRGILTTGLMATLGGIILNVVFLYLAHTVFDIWPRVTMGQSTELVTLGYAQVVIATLVPGLVATLLYWVLVRFTAWPNILFGLLSFVVLVLSFFGPFMLEIPGAEQLVLVILHVLPALAITPTLMIAGLFSEDTCCDDCDMEEFCDDENCEECIIICDECGEEDCELHGGVMMMDEDCECDCEGDCECDDDCVCDKEDGDECCGKGCCKDDATSKKDVE